MAHLSSAHGPVSKLDHEITVVVDGGDLRHKTKPLKGPDKSPGRLGNQAKNAEKKTQLVGRPFGEPTEGRQARACLLVDRPVDWIRS